MARIDYEKRRRKQIVDERGPLPWWRRRWPPTIRPEAATPSIPARRDAEPSIPPLDVRVLIAEIQKQVQARLAGLDSNIDDADEPGIGGFVKGARFTYRSVRGKVTEYRIVRVASGRAYTDKGKEFKVSLLEKLSRGRDPVVELL